MFRSLASLALLMSFSMTSTQSHAQFDSNTLTPNTPGKSAPPVAPGASGRSNTGGVVEQVTQEEVDRRNRVARSFTEPETTCDASSNTPAGRAARATVQLIPRSLVFEEINGPGLRIRPETNQKLSKEWCAGHPFADRSGAAPTQDNPDPSRYRSLDPAAARDEKGSTLKVCSGFLAANQQTIATAGHCTWGLSMGEFCSKYVIVFGRACGQTEFTRDQIFDCNGAGGEAVDQTRVKGFNVPSDTGSRDHAFLQLTRQVPAETALPIPIVADRPNRSLGADTRGHTMLGHPHGHHRMRSPLRTPGFKTASSGNYCYHSFRGYAYTGNSGGPIVNADGEAVGIVAAADDREYGDAGAREVNRPIAGTDITCHTNRVPETGNTLEAVGFCGEVRAAMNRVAAQSTSSAGVQASPAPRATQPTAR